MAKKALLEQQLRDLDGVGGSALADLVAAAPEVQTALVGQVLTNAADIDDVLIGRVERHGVDLVLEVVDELAARGVCDELLGTLDADLLLRAQHDGYAVAADDGHARAGAADLHLGQVEDLAALVLHLHLLARVAHVRLAADLGDDVVGDLVLEHLRLDGLARGERRDLIVQLVDAVLARAGDRLIGAGDDGLDGAFLRQRVDGDEGDDGGAVGVGDDAAVPLHVLGVDLGDDQRHLGIETEGAGVVDEHRAGLNDGGREALGNVVLRRAEHDVETLKGVVRRLDDRALPAAEVDLAARAARGGDGAQLADGELALEQNFHHFLTHGARRAENAYIIKLHGITLTFSLNMFLDKAVIQYANYFHSIIIVA